MNDDESPKSDASDRSRKRDKTIITLSAVNAGEEVETQGDHLNRIKAQRRNARSATSATSAAAVNLEDARCHLRSTSQPKGDSYISPLKSLKQQTTVSIYNTRASIKKQNKNTTIETVTDKYMVAVENGGAADVPARLRGLKKFTELNGPQQHNTKRYVRFVKNDDILNNFLIKFCFEFYFQVLLMM